MLPIRCSVLFQLGLPQLKEISRKEDTHQVLLSLFGACRDYLRGSVPYASTVQLPITQNHLVTATATEVCYCPASTDHISGVKHIGWQAERNLHSHSKCCRNRLASASVITYQDLAPRVQLASYWQTEERKQSGLRSFEHGKTEKCPQEGQG